MPWAEPVGKKWRGVYRDATGRKVTSAPVTHKPAALEWARTNEQMSRRHANHDPFAGRTPLREWAERWMSARTVAATSAAGEVSRYRRLIDEFGDWPIEAILPLDVQSWVTRLERDDGLGAWAVRHHHSLLSTMMRDAVRNRLISESPCTGTRLPETPSGREVFWTVDEVDQLVSELAEPHATIAYVLAWTGLRWGELAGLHLNRLHLLRKRLDVVETMTEIGGQRAIKAYAKARGSKPGPHRELPLEDDVVERLAAHLAQFPARPCPPNVPHPRGVPCSGLVFSGTRTGTLTRHWNHDKMRPALERAGLQPGSPHDLRHTYASWLVQNGTILPEVQALLGHKSLAMVMRYAHFAPDYGERARRVLQGLRQGGTNCDEQRTAGDER